MNLDKKNESKSSRRKIDRTMIWVAVIAVILVNLVVISLWPEGPPHEGFQAHQEASPISVQGFSTQNQNMIELTSDGELGVTSIWISNDKIDTTYQLPTEYNEYLNANHYLYDNQHFVFIYTDSNHGMLAIPTQNHEPIQTFPFYAQVDTIYNIMVYFKTETSSNLYIRNLLTHDEMFQEFLFKCPTACECIDSAAVVNDSLFIHYKISETDTTFQESMYDISELLIP